MPGGYFTPHTAMPTPDIPCRDNGYLNGLRLDTYIAKTGDIDAMVIENGKKMFKCENEWAYSPACRRLIEKGGQGCIPLVCYKGWSSYSFMQLAYWHNMPVALGAVERDQWERAAADYQALMYWNLPDSTFANINVQMLQFPPYDKIENKR